MRTVKFQQTGPALIVAEKNQIFAEKSQGKGSASVRQLFGKSRRLPVAAHQLAARGSAIGSRKKFNLLIGCHFILSLGNAF
jgi:hypothetical protein